MPALIPTKYTGRIAWLGRVPDRDAALQSQPADALEARFSGVDGEAHGGLTRPSCSRVSTQYPVGTEIANTRQLSILSQEELDAIAAEMGLPAIAPEAMGATMIVSGIPDFTHVPPSSRLQAASGATLVVDMENRPCSLLRPTVGRGSEGHQQDIKAASKGRRGVTAWVEREGILRVGDPITLHIPDQRGWMP